MNLTTVKYDIDEGFQRFVSNFWLIIIGATIFALSISGILSMYGSYHPAYTGPEFVKVASKKSSIFIQPSSSQSSDENNGYVCTKSSSSTHATTYAVASTPQKKPLTLLNTPSNNETNNKTASKTIDTIASGSPVSPDPIIVSPDQGILPPSVAEPEPAPETIVNQLPSKSVTDIVENTEKQTSNAAQELEVNLVLPL